ncbi:MAG: hypothetical protein Q7U04_15295 [Bacteriovorax sp.]|nr:hypothetical protein [Bacteriovorax sp.]
MENEKRKNRLEYFRNYGYGLLRYIVMTLITGAMALMYYEAGKMHLFGDEDPIARACERREQGYSKPDDGLAEEILNEDIGEMYEE